MNLMRFPFFAALLFGGLTTLGADQPRITLPPYATLKLENGLTVLLMEKHELPLISFVWLMKSGGGICDPQGGDGVASLTAQLLRKGTRTRSADDISETLDFAGASFWAHASHDYSSGSAEFLSKDLDLGVELLADLLQNPVFPDDELAKLVKQEVDAIAEQKEVPNQVIARYFRQLLFGAHPYGRPVSGTEETLPRITREQVVAFHRAQYSPGELIFAIVGDFEPQKLRPKLTQSFGNWGRKATRIPPLSSPVTPDASRVLLVNKPDATQTFFRLGNVGLPRTSPDWVPLRVVNTLFGGRFTSMINTALRIDSGLTYGASSAFSANPVAGEFFIGSFTKNETTSQALEMTIDVLKKLHREGITAEQLQSAKSYIKGQFGPTLETNDQLAGTIAELEFFGLGPEYINTFFERVDDVTLEDARRLIRRYFPADKLAMVLIGQEQVIQPVGAKLASEVKRKSITEPGF